FHMADNEILRIMSVDLIGLISCRKCCIAFFMSKLNSYRYTKYDLIQMKIAATERYAAFSTTNQPSKFHTHFPRYCIICQRTKSWWVHHYYPFIHELVIICQRRILSL